MIITITITITIIIDHIIIHLNTLLFWYNAAHNYAGTSLCHNGQTKQYTASHGMDASRQTKSHDYAVIGFNHY
jgi:hypothetical protein